MLQPEQNEGYLTSHKIHWKPMVQFLNGKIKMIKNLLVYELGIFPLLQTCVSSSFSSSYQMKTDLHKQSGHLLSLQHRGKQ